MLTRVRGPLLLTLTLGVISACSSTVAPSADRAAVPAPHTVSPATTTLLASGRTDPTEVAGTQEAGGVKARTSKLEACPANMVLVEGDYCTEAKQECVEWLDPAGSRLARCKVFGPSECVGERVRKRFCIDRDEYTKAGESLPANHSSWTDAKETCEASGKRLCLESEWNFACEGEEMYAYGIGNTRDSSKCNYDRMNLVDDRGKPRDYRKSPDETKQCVSPFGVRNMTGNVDEWTMRDATNGRFKAAMKGGWWMAARNRCRPATVDHDELYKDFQTGFRCCRDPQ